MAYRRHPAPNKTMKRIVGSQISLREISFNRLLKRNHVNVLPSNIFFKLGTTTSVAATPNVPKKVAHLNNTVAKAHPLDVTGFATRFLAGARLVEAIASTSLASEFPLATTADPTGSETTSAMAEASLALANAAAAAKAAWASSRARINDTNSPLSAPTLKPLSSRIETSSGSVKAFRILKEGGGLPEVSRFFSARRSYALSMEESSPNWALARALGARWATGEARERRALAETPTEPRAACRSTQAGAVGDGRESTAALAEGLRPAVFLGVRSEPPAL